MTAEEAAEIRRLRADAPWRWARVRPARCTGRGRRVRRRVTRVRALAAQKFALSVLFLGGGVELDVVPAQRAAGHPRARVTSARGAHPNPVGSPDLPPQSLRQPRAARPPQQQEAFIALAQLMAAHAAPSGGLINTFSVAYCPPCRFLLPARVSLQLLSSSSARVTLTCATGFTPEGYPAYEMRQMSAPPGSLSPPC